MPPSAPAVRQPDFHIATHGAVRLIHQSTAPHSPCAGAGERAFTDLIKGDVRFENANLSRHDPGQVQRLAYPHLRQPNRRPPHEHHTRDTTRRTRVQQALSGDDRGCARLPAAHARPPAGHRGKGWQKAQQAFHPETQLAREPLPTLPPSGAAGKCATPTHQRCS